MIKYIRSIFFFIMFFSFLSSNGQSMLSLIKYRNGKRITIKQGETLKIHSGTSIIKGELFEILDSHIIIAQDTTLDTCQLSTIKWIQYKHKNFGNSFMQGSAKSAISAGPLYIVFGLANNALAGIEPIAQERNFKTAGIISLIGISWYLAVEYITNKKHRINRCKIIPINFNNL